MGEKGRRKRKWRKGKGEKWREKMRQRKVMGGWARKKRDYFKQKVLEKVKKKIAQISVSCLPLFSFPNKPRFLATLTLCYVVSACSIYVSQVTSNIVTAKGERNYNSCRGWKRETSDGKVVVVARRNSGSQRTGGLFQRDGLAFVSLYRVENQSRSHVTRERFILHFSRPNLVR